MDLKKIEIFLMVEKYGSFTRIAEKLAYTPSAIVHIADSLEKELGVKLFNRNNKGVELTDDARKLHGRFVALFEAQEELYSAAADIAQKQSLELKIVTYSSIATYVLPEILRGFKKEYPSISFSIVVENDIADLLKHGESDIFFADSCPDNMSKWIPIMEDEYVAVVPETEFATLNTISRTEMYKYQYIRVDDTIIDAYFTYSEFNGLISLKSAENNSAISLVREKIGLAVMPGIMARNCPEGVRTLWLEPKLTRIIGIAYNPQKASWAAEKFVEYVKNKEGDY